jgi:Family of unknown function (DUF6129)
MLEATTIERIAAQVTAQGLNETTLQTLRADWPELRFTYSSDDDICGPAPYLQAEGFNLYLLGAREHCPALTADLTVASGVVLADVERDDE